MFLTAVRLDDNSLDKFNSLSLISVYNQIIYNIYTIKT